MADAPAPVEIPGYEILEEIGRGGQARVYRARQVAVDRTVALKVLDRARLDDTTLMRFERECRSAGALSWHPNIVAIYDAGTTPDGLPYLSMEFLGAGSLRERVERSGPLPWTQVAPIGIQLAGALETAHREGMLHRDVKPDNVMLGPFGEAKLADFGIAAIAGGTVTGTGAVTATLAHAAPEVLSGQRATAASDVYSLGSTLFALLAGKPAFMEDTDESIVTLLARVATSPVPDLRAHAVPGEVASVMEAAMAKEPGDRLSTAAAFGEALQAAQRALDAPVTELRLRAPAAPPPPPGEATVTVGGPPRPLETVPSRAEALPPLRPPPREIAPRRRWPWLVGAALLLGASAGGAVVLFSSDGDDARAQFELVYATATEDRRQVVDAIQERLDALALGARADLRDGDVVVTVAEENLTKTRDALAVQGALEFRPVLNLTPGPGVPNDAPDAAILPPDQPIEAPDREGQVVYALGPAEVLGDAVAAARAQLIPGSGWGVTLEFTPEGAEAFDASAARHVGEQVAIVVDGVVEVAPTIEVADFGGEAVITGVFTEEEARRLAAALTSPLTATLELRSSRESKA